MNAQSQFSNDGSKATDAKTFRSSFAPQTTSTNATKAINSDLDISPARDLMARIEDS